MRILDKNTDFYDYFQNIYPDNSITFDRTGSYVLTRSDLCGYLHRFRGVYVGHIEFLLLQVCNTFWLFAATITKVDDNLSPRDCTIDLIDKWKNYNKPRIRMRLSVISFKWEIDNLFRSRKRWGDRWLWDVDEMRKRSSVLIAEIDHNNYEIKRNIGSDNLTRDDGSVIKRNAPLLKASGLAQFIDPLEIYLAFEEFFSLEKTDSERTESVGLTNTEKIENHGFDIKSSFRGNA